MSIIPPKHTQKTKLISVADTEEEGQTGKTLQQQHQFDCSMKADTKHKPNKTLKMGSQKMVLACVFSVQKSSSQSFFSSRSYSEVWSAFSSSSYSILFPDYCNTQSVQERESARETSSANNNTVKGETGKQTKPAAERPRQQSRDRSTGPKLVQCFFFFFFG